MPAFPRSAGAMPRLATPPRFPFGLQSWGISGRGQLRAVKNAGRVWTETYPVLDTANPSVRALLETLNRSIRSGLLWDIQHPYWHVRKGVGGGSAVTHSPIQIIALQEALGSWNVNGTPVLTAGQSDPFGGGAAYLINDDDAAGVERIWLGITFSGDGTKTISVYFKAGTLVTDQFGLWDNTATVWRHKVVITWTAGVPSLSTGVGGGTLFPVEPVVTAPGWYRLSFSANSVVAANANQLYIGSDVAASTGTHFVFGANAWDATTPGPYRGPSNPGPLSGPGTQAGSVLYVRGAPVSTSAWLRQGDMIDFPGSPVVLDVTAQVDTNAAGGAQIPISPPLFTNYYVADNVAVTTDPTLITFSAVIDGMEAPPGMDTTRYIDAGLSVTWREALP